MKLTFLLTILLGTFVGCERTGKQVAGKPEVIQSVDGGGTTITEAESPFARIGQRVHEPHQNRDADIAEVEKLMKSWAIKKRSLEEPFEEEALRMFEEIAPRIFDTKEFWTFMSFAQPAHFSRLRQLMYDGLQAMEPKPDEGEPLMIRSAFRTAQFTQDPEVARIALQFLPKAPRYRFPQTPPREGWPTPADMDRMERGLEGKLATTVVELGDAETRAKYRAYIDSAPVERQRVLLWALGRSADPIDFGWLLARLAKTNDDKLRETIIQSLNRIPGFMEAVGKEPEKYALQRRPENSLVLLDSADRYRALLKEKGLVVELTMWDHGF